MQRNKAALAVFCVGTWILLLIGAVHAEISPQENTYPVGKLKPRNSETTLKVGDKAPDFTLPAVKGGSMSLGQFMGRKNVVLSFVPAAWTPVCTYQWPVYDMAKEIFDDNDAVLLGITVDNIPTLYAWTRAIAHSKEGFWFPVLSDFYPHGQVAKKYGVLRQEGFAERALFVIDKKGIIRFMDIHDINERPPLTQLQKALQLLK
jgi:alkyl hydroperoxide reductase subunit AhpC